MPLQKCPTCGSNRIQRKVVDLEWTAKGKNKIVPGIELEVCPECGEKLFDLAAMDRLESIIPPRRPRSKVRKK